MLGTTIARRILGSFLLLTLTALLVLGLVLTSYFQSAALRDAQGDLVTHARIIALALEHDARQSTLDEPIAEISAQTGLRITVLDDEGRVLADSDRDAQAMENHWERPEIQQALAEGLGTATRYSATVGANMLYVAVPWRENGRLVGIIRTATSLAPIDATVQQTVTELVPRAQKKQQHVDVHIETSAKLLANADLFGQILRNLIDNAIKYTPAGGTIRLACAENDGQIEITVADNGIGIPQDALPRIFDRFYRVDKARDRASGGNGIGLSLVQFLVKLFDGTIEAQSEVGKGTRFVLRFPKVEGKTS